MAFSDQELSEARFNNPFVEVFPGDQSGDLHSRQTPGHFYALTRPTPTEQSRIIAWSDELGREIGLRRPAGGSLSERILAGGAVTDTMKPFSARYGGHQFGSWAGQLGDGRAIVLGELNGRAGQPFELQLKGAGRTAYSRRADGRAVLRSSLREFIASEALFHLGIPTTRALSLALTGEKVERDMFYSGDPQLETGAITARIAPTFLRFGNFEILAREKNTDGLQRLFRYTVDRFFPEIDSHADSAVEEWLTEIAERTARMIAKWMGYGFVHGVMNTDNMSILGVTIDFGPFGWLEPYETNWTPNTTDFQNRRYAYGQQPVIGFWNLAMLATAVAPLIKDPPALDRSLDRYRAQFPQALEEVFFARLGLSSKLVHSLRVRCTGEMLGVFAAARMDMTLFFRGLTDMYDTLSPNTAGAGAQRLLERAAYAPITTELHRQLTGWLERYADLISQNDPGTDVRSEMLRVNPVIVPRNWILQEVIDACEQGNDEPLRELQRRIAAPFRSVGEGDRWEERRPEWAATRPGCATLSCSS
jgi:serine/tyrosine/threonine adenylyltransferase